MGRATTALLDADPPLAESVISRDAAVDHLAAQVEASIVEPPATQRPVAVDLRTVLTALRMAGELERMGDLAEHIAKVARMRHPEPAIPPELRDIVLEMGRAAERPVAKAGTCVATRDARLAAELETDDDVMDRLRRRLFRALPAGDRPHGLEPAVDVTPLGRYYERYADHAVRVTRDAVHLVTGSRPAPASAP